ncbi:MAG: glycosyltransferase family 2 protein, partial [Candidatus Omnitrophica bacterium]|nr:glycosyltransferase family 2 protein [Candidatus Omnitrophota bacterium]
MKLSIIIPAYNEEQRIENTLLKMYDFLKNQGYDYEVIVVDDGSKDNTIGKAQASRLYKEGRLKIEKNQSNRGKGFSVRAGILKSSGDYVLFSDADLSTPIEEINKLFVYADKDYDIAIGSRSIKDSDVKIHQPWYREVMGKIFNIFVKVLLIRDFNDTQCGFKLFKGAVAKDIARVLKINGFCFDVEMLYLAKVKGCRIKEVGVTWNNSPQTKVKALKSSVNMFLSLLKIRM